VVVVSDLNKNIGGSTDLVEKRHRSGDLHTPIHLPHKGTRMVKDGVDWPGLQMTNLKNLG